MKKITLMVMMLSALFVGMVFAGGAADTKQGAPAQGSSAAAGQTEKVTLTMSWWGNDARHNAIQAALEKFQEKYPSITVQPTFGGWDGYHDKLTVQLASKTAPDVFAFSTSKTLDYGLSGQLIDFNTLKADMPVLASLSDVLKAAPSRYYAGDKLVGMPAGLTVFCVVYDKKLFDDAKVPYPTDNESWVSLYEKYRAVHKALPKVYGEGGWFYTTDLYMYLLKQMGVEPLDVSKKPPVVNFDNDASRKIWTWVESLWADGTVARDQGDDVQFKYGNQAAKIAPVSTYIGSQAQTTDPLGVAVFPKTFDGTGKKVIIAPQPAFDFGIAASSKHPKEAALLINFLLSDIEAGKALGLSLGIPPSPALAADLQSNVYKAGAPETKVLDIIPRSMKNIDVSWMIPAVQGWDEADDNFQSILEGYVFKKIDMNQFIDSSQKKVNEILAAENK